MFEKKAPAGSDPSDTDLVKQLHELRDHEPSPALAARLLTEVPVQPHRPQRVRARRIPVYGLAAAATIVIAVLLARSGGVHSRGLSEILAPVARASGLAQAVHVVMNVRTDVREDFESVKLDADVSRLECWIRWPRGESDRGRMRIEKAGIRFVFDGTTGTGYRNSTNEAWQGPGGLKYESFWPAAWLEGILDLPGDARVVSREENNGEGRVVLRWPAQELNGRSPAFFSEFEREVEVRWNLGTSRLTGFTRWVFADGERRLFSEIVSIEYLDTIDDSLFRPDLPADVRWCTLVAATPEIDALPAREAALRFWNASIQGDWETVKIFCASPAAIEWLGEARPVELISLGEPFESGDYPGVLIPYEVRYGGQGGRVARSNIAMKRDKATGRWVTDGGI